MVSACCRLTNGCSGLVKLSLPLHTQGKRQFAQPLILGVSSHGTRSAKLWSTTYEARPMARAITDLENEIRSLPPQAQERLLHVLLEELDGPADPGAEEAWLREIQRRSRELDQGSVETVPAEEVFANLRKRLKANGR
jgi:putative addiction module component (TIGR02574 family)